MQFLSYLPLLWKGINPERLRFYRKLKSARNVLSMGGDPNPAPQSSMDLETYKDLLGAIQELNGGGHLTY